MRKRPIVTVKCYWCPVEDFATVQPTPWLRYCPECHRVTWIEHGKVDEVKTLREQAKLIARERG